MATKAVITVEPPAKPDESTATLKAEIAALKAKTATLEAEVTALKAEAAELKAAVPVKPEVDCVDIVVVPIADGAKVPDSLTFNGERCLTKIDEHGFRHFKVPKIYAERLLTLDGALKYYLAGNEKPLKVKVPNGLYNPVVVFLPHKYDGKEWRAFGKAED